MKKQFYFMAGALFLFLGLCVFAQQTIMKSKQISAQAHGTFAVKLTPQPESDPDSKMGRLLIEKQFFGDLQGSSKGQMLSALTVQTGSAGYVAIERVEGQLQGRKGTFMLQHSGIMDRGAQSLTIVVVPDSGSDELRGLTGKMMIKIEEGKHFYSFEYSLPAS